MAEPIFIYWAMCSECGYETAVHGRVKCPDCNCLMTKTAEAGSILDSRAGIETGRETAEALYRLYPCDCGSRSFHVAADDHIRCRQCEHIPREILAYPVPTGLNVSIEVLDDEC